MTAIGTAALKHRNDAANLPPHMKGQLGRIRKAVGSGDLSITDLTNVDSELMELWETIADITRESRKRREQLEAEAEAAAKKAAEADSKETQDAAQVA